MFARLPFNVSVNVSGPSVVKSLANVNVLVAVPKMLSTELTVKLPVSVPALKSLALMPVTVYGTNVPLST